MQTVNSPLLILGAWLIVAAGSSVQALADLKIRLKDGRVITVPVDRHDVDSMAYQKAAGQKTTGRRPVAERAADKIREDARQVRSASQAAQKAQAAADRADEAAKAAVAAAAVAKKAAREAAKAAGLARRTAHTPPKSADRPFSSPRSKAAPPLGQTILSVGPGKAFDVPSKAAKAARDGDVIEIQAGTYRGDVAIWRANNLVIRGVGGRVVVDAAGKSAGRKATWLVLGLNTTVQNIAFTGARVSDKNGAGIRLEGTGLIVRDCEFYDNEMGILTSSNSESDILIERSRFYRNTVDYPRYRKLGHNIYVGRVRSFTLRFSKISGARYGHNVKSRAQTNRIAYNKIIDGPDGSSSYLLDLHGGGRSYIIGNILQQGRNAENWTMVSVGAENPRATEALYIVNNTFVNDKESGVFVQRKSVGETLLLNNIFAGSGTPLVGSGSLKSNLIIDDRPGSRLRSVFWDGSLQRAEGDLEGNFLGLTAGFVDSDKMDYRLRKESPAIDAGASLPSVSGENLTPLFQYRRGMKSDRRNRHGRIDIGAYEYSAD